MNIMETNETKEYIPFAPVHPFDILKDELKARGIRNKDFAKSIGMAPSNFSRMLKAKGELTSEMAMKLEAQLGIPYLHWMGFYEDFIKDTVKIKERSIEEMKAKAQEEALDKAVNMGELYKRFKLLLKPLAERLEFLSPFFSLIADTERLAAEGRFKKSELRQTDKRNLLTWIILARHGASEAVKNNKEYVKGEADKAADEIVAHTHKGDITKQLVSDILGRHGIGYVHVPKLEKTPVDAYSIFSDDKPCIVVTYRYASDRDKFVFDILHELGHISLHFEKGLGSSFLKMDESIEDKQLEGEANEYAANKLIPPKIWREIVKPMYVGIEDFNGRCQTVGDRAKGMGLSPSIAVSRYKHTESKYNSRVYPSRPLI